MIYYIVAKDPATHNEWVMSTHDSVVSATKYCDEYRKQETGYEYRIDTTENSKFHSNAFTVSELFPPTEHRGTTSDCVECGAYVRIPQQVKHAAWHNKLADL